MIDVIRRCLNCIHGMFPRHHEAQCGHSSALRTDTEGEKYHATTESMRHETGPCGKAGNLFEPKE